MTTPHLKRADKVTGIGASALVAAAALAAASASAQIATRDHISIVGSSTVYPFATVVAEQFGRTTKFKTPTIESTGSGGGFKLFCNGVGVAYPDITNASRRIKSSEVETCAKNGVNDIVEVKIGFDGIVIANSADAPHFDLSLHEIYLALAKNVPDPAGTDKLVANPYETWSEIDPSLPDFEIEVLGPPPTSGTRDAFLELAMEGGCKTFAFVAAMAEDDRIVACHTLREDGAYIEAGENDNLIVQKLEANPSQLGIFGYSFLEENMDKVQGASIDGVTPDFDAIASSDYPISRPLFFYVKKAHVDIIPGMREYLREFTSEDAMGEFGYLSDRGLIPLSEEEREAVAAKVDKLENLDLSAQVR
jgi:phosphate transport system substrate-binding protein